MRRNNTSAVTAMARPGALPVPQSNSLSAFTHPEVVEKWAEETSQVRAMDSAGDNAIEIYDRIGYDFWTDGGITAKTISEKLKSMRGMDVDVMINSPGGDMFEGFAIYNVLREHDAKIIVKIMGMAASAGSVIAMAGDTIQIGAASFMMMHNCGVVAGGNRHELREVAEWMEPFDQAMADIYSSRSGQSVEDIVKWMDAETFMSGTTAIDRGFADELLSADSVIEDEGARAQAKDIHVVRAMESTLMAAGQSRTQARAHINKIKGKPDAAQNGKQDAADADWMQDASELLQNLKK